jgi:hypothetical protein
MFGLNDLTVLPIADFRANLTEIIRRCRHAGAEVLLCTPNSVITTSDRPVPKLMEPLDEVIAKALHAVFPDAKIEVLRWPTAGQSLAQIETASKTVRGAPVDLVLIAVPASVTPPAESPAEEQIRSHSWILNWSLSFGRQEWDVVVVAPSVLQTELTPQEQAADLFARRMVQAQDLNLITRQSGDSSPPERILEVWFRTQLAGK